MGLNELRGIDELRCMVSYFNWHNETFNQSFTHEELRLIWGFHDSEEGNTVPEMADTWPGPLLEKALGNNIYRDYKYTDDCGKRCECWYCKHYYAPSEEL